MFSLSTLPNATKLFPNQRLCVKNTPSPNSKLLPTNAQGSGFLLKTQQHCFQGEGEREESVGYEVQKKCPPNMQFSQQFCPRLQAFLRIECKHKHACILELMVVLVHIWRQSSCSNTSRRQISPNVQVRRLLVAATYCGDTSQRLITPSVPPWSATRQGTQHDAATFGLFLCIG